MEQISVDEIEFILEFNSLDNHGKIIAHEVKRYVVNMSDMHPVSESLPAINRQLDIIRRK